MAPPPQREQPGRSAGLADRVKDPGFTPSVRDVDALIDLLADEDLARGVERAIGRVGAAALPHLRARLSAARPPVRARIVNAIGRFGADAGAAQILAGVLSDESTDPKSRRNAAIALGRSRAPGAAEALKSAWKREQRPEMRRSIAAALGKVAGPDALDLLRDARVADDAELARIAERASVMIERTASRPPGPALDAGRAPDRAVDVVLVTRSGLEAVLAAELGAIRDVDRVQAESAGRVRAVLAGPLASLFAARTWLDLRFPVSGEVPGEGEATAAAIAHALSSPTARRVLGTWSAGAPRYRIAWVDAGHRRAATWDAVRAIAARTPDLVNDPTASAWEVLVTTRGGAVAVALSPKGLVDPRFAWRRRDVPAASHPVVAAALARIGEVAPDDVVWDPFVGSGAELIERRLLGPARALFGTDTDPRALEAARENLAAAGLEATLSRADALGGAPPGVTLILTNPPMGRRSLRAAGTADLLDRFVTYAASVLARGGRLVWIAPWPARARVAAERAGMVLERARPLDMGGFEAEIQRWRRA